MRHIIITGTNGVGKSTLIRALLNETSQPVCGVITKKEAPRADGYCPVYIHRFGAPRVFSDDNCIGLCRDGHSVARPEAFDCFAAAIEVSACGVTVLDELGFLESNAHIFTKAILSVLDESPLVIAAVRDKDTEFLNAVRAHPRSDVYRITEENRDALREQLLAALPRYLSDAFPPIGSSD